MNFDSIVFDLDGTLTESGIGITRSVAYAYEKMGLAVPEQAVLDRFVGPPLVAAFMEYAGLDEAGARRATACYRERFSETGWKENCVYPGITPILKALKRAGKYVAIASGKPEIFVKRITDYFGITRYFDRIIGIQLETSKADKIELITAALPEGYDPARTCMVGDRRFDMEAARKMGLYALGAGYGYGSEAELREAGAEKIASDVHGLSEILLDGIEPEPGYFISFEGADGCGKSTQHSLLKQYLTQRGYEVVASREPGGCEISERIREVVLDIDLKGMSDACEALLFAASRAEHVRQVILPAVKSGKIMLCDRFLDSSIAYQAHGRELGERFIRQINEPASVIRPDRTLLFVGNRAKVSRRLHESQQLDRIEVEKDSFVRRVYDAYEQIHLSEPERVHVIDSDRTIEEIFEDVCREVNELIDGGRA